jgi:lipopolysaccharide export system protein LptA
MEAPFRVRFDEMFALLIAVFLFLPHLVQGQTGAGPDIPIVLEHADSIVGTGQFESSVRTFYGNVRFQQGNVTGRCDRAIHNVMANTVELFGNVVVRQGALTMKAPEIRYSGTKYIAIAPKGIRVEQNGQVITAKKGVYATNTHVADFFGEVYMHNDTTSVWSDTLTYDRDADTMRANGAVVGYDSTGSVWFEADVARRNAITAEYRLSGHAVVWTWESGKDTMLVSADSIHSERQSGTNARALHALGSACLVKGLTAARAGSIRYSETNAQVELEENPYVWSDSIAFTAGSIQASIPQRKLESMIGSQSALLMSAIANTQPRRFDQIYGRMIDLSFSEDSLRTIRAAGDAQSITFKGEGPKQEGLAKVASDSLRAVFSNGKLSDVFWLGGIAGEHHPERLIAGKEEEYLLPKFLWRTDRPAFRKPRTARIR